MDQEIVNEVRAPQLPRRRWWRDVLLAIVLFGCGFLVGGVVLTHIYISRAPIFQRSGVERERAFSHLRKSLKLDEEQSRKVREIVDKGLDDLREVRHSVKPQVESILERVRTEVSQTLDERQRRIWERRFNLVRQHWFPIVPEPESRERFPEGRHR
jgi:hypothetical protein